MDGLKSEPEHLWHEQISTCSEVFSHVLSLVFQPHPAFLVFGVEADAFRRLDYLGPAADPRHMWNRSSNLLINGDKWSNLHPKWCHNAYIYSYLSMLVPCLWVGRNELLQSHWSLMARISLRRLSRLAVTICCQKLKFEIRRFLRCVARADALRLRSQREAYLTHPYPKIATEPLHFRHASEGSGKAMRCRPVLSVIWPFAKNNWQKFCTSCWMVLIVSVDLVVFPLRYEAARN